MGHDWLEGGFISGSSSLYIFDLIIKWNVHMYWTPPPKSHGPEVTLQANVWPAKLTPPPKKKQQLKTNKLWPLITPYFGSSDPSGLTLLVGHWWLLDSQVGPLRWMHHHHHHYHWDRLDWSSSQQQWRDSLVVVVRPLSGRADESVRHDVSGCLQTQRHPSYYRPIGNM